VEQQPVDVAILINLAVMELLVKVVNLLAKMVLVSHHQVENVNP
jgi:hypothetical protein